MIACSYKPDTFHPAEAVKFPFHYLLIAPRLAQGKWSHVGSLCWERSLNAYPFLEICKGDLIHYMCPLENQVDFCVPELHEKKTSDDTEETVEHKDVDVKESVAGWDLSRTEPDNDDKTILRCDNDLLEGVIQAVNRANSSVTVLKSTKGEPEQKSIPVIQEVVEESREVVETSAPLLESSQPSLGEEEGQSEDGDQGGKGSNESVGSGSSFEELDMELEEEKEEKTNEAEAEDHNGQQKLMMVGETIENREE
ncbi:Testis-expressed protein 264 [Labeo rohita]|uniref:Testis-expressed protein 264 n=1 Tax=Labeo rohita TaxID=84645 RepID=A0ABQ8MLP7_LABRO|nr:Testis-expressed protein 264 [Labeo rohita]